MPALTARFAALTALVGVVHLVVPVPQPSGAFVAIGLLLGLFVLDMGLAPNPSRIGIVRDLPTVLTVARGATVSWTIENHSLRPSRIWFSDALPESLGARDRRHRIRLGQRETAELSVPVRPTRRGRFVVDEIVVRSEGPLGVGARQARRSMPQPLRVFPAFSSRDEAELRINRARLLEVGLQSAKGRGGGTEFDQLREYSDDDEFRRIDWAATARLGKPIVRTFRAEQHQTVLNLLDNGRVMAGQVDGVARVEHAMDAVMMLTAVATRLGDRTGLVTFDTEVRSVVPPSHGPAQLSRVTEAMYTLDPQLLGSNYVGVFAETMARFKRRSLFVLFTDLVEEAVGEALLPALPLILRHHVVLVAAVTDPEVEHIATSAADDALGAYHVAAAVAALDERRRTTVKLRSLGVTVVDAPPSKIGAELTDAYLRIKATSQL